MESIVSKGTKPEFLHFVVLTLENRMPWKTLNNLLIELAPSLNETREIICILLKELETLQSTLHRKQKELERFQNQNDNNMEIKVLEDEMNKEATFVINEANEVIQYRDDCENQVNPSIENAFESYRGNDTERKVVRDV